MLQFLASFTVILVLSIATLNYIGNRREKQRASLLALVKHATLKCAMITEFRTLAAGDSLGRAAQTVMHTLQNDFLLSRENARLWGRPQNLVRHLREGPKESGFVTEGNAARIPQCGVHRCKERATEAGR